MQLGAFANDLLPNIKEQQHARIRS